MAVFWQQIMVFAAVCLAMVYLVVYYVRRRRRKAGCASCPTLKVLQSQAEIKTK